MSALSEIWKRTAPGHAQYRFNQTKISLETLREMALIPAIPQIVMDVGYGSGGGTIALKEVFPQSQVVAVDNSSTHQYYREYSHRSLPRWTAIDEYSNDIRDIASRLPKADLVMASRMPILYNLKESWREFCAESATIVLALARCVAENGALTIGYNPGQETGTPTLSELSAIFKWRDLFGRQYQEEVLEDNDWLVFTHPQPNIEILTPYDILTEYGNREQDPHVYLRYDDE